MFEGIAINAGTTRRLRGFVVPESRWYANRRKTAHVTVTEVIGQRVLYITAKGEKRESTMYGFTQCYKPVTDEKAASVE
jgi:hypothetical protein